VEATCSRAVIIMNGKVRADARLEELARSSTAVLALESPGVDVNTITAELEKLSAVTGVVSHSDNGRVIFEVNVDSSEDICPAIFRLAADNNWPVAELRRSERTLETVFNELAREGESK
jgi:ABC-type multidrug transport system ATPase subunit